MPHSLLEDFLQTTPAYRGYLRMQDMAFPYDRAVAGPGMELDRVLDEAWTDGSNHFTVFGQPAEPTGEGDGLLCLFQCEGLSEPAVVRLDLSDREITLLAPDVRTFLARLASGQPVDLSYEASFDELPGVVQQRGWRGEVAKLMVFAAKTGVTPIKAPRGDRHFEVQDLIAQWHDASTPW